MLFTASHRGVCLPGGVLGRQRPPEPGADRRHQVVLRDARPDSEARHQSGAGAQPVPAHVAEAHGRRVHVSLSVCLSVCLSVYVHIPAHVTEAHGSRVHVSQSVCLSISLSVCRSRT